MSELATDFHERYVLDGTKINLHMDRVRAWERGERVPPTTVDCSLNQRCNYSCSWCFMQTQKQAKMERITVPIALQFIEDMAEVGVRGVSLVSDGESTMHPAYVPFIKRGAELGVSMASGTNAYIFDEEMLEAVLPHLTYLRVNFSAGEPKRYAEIMGTKEASFHRVCENIRTMVRIKKRDDLPVTIGMQMVLDPRDSDQIVPFAKLGQELRPQYAIIKHCSDTKDHELGVDYSRYESLYPLLHEAESYSDETYQCVVKWRKIRDGNVRSYKRCLGPPHLLQVSGTGLVSPCGMTFSDKFKQFHIANICETRFRDIVKSDRYWEVIRYLASDEFDAQRTCSELCLQHYVNVALDNHQKGLEILSEPTGPPPAHVNFI